MAAVGGTVVGSQVLVSGNVHGSSDVTINGRLDGRVDLTATLTVGPAALVKADLVVSRAVVLGCVVGNIHARETVELRAGSRVVGDIVTPQLVMEDGALFRGNVLTPDMVVARPVVEQVVPVTREKSTPPRARPMPKPVSVRKTQPPPMAPMVTAPPPPPPPPPEPEAVVDEAEEEEAPPPPVKQPRKKATAPKAPAAPPPPPAEAPRPRALPGRDSGARVQVRRR